MKIYSHVEMQWNGEAYVEVSSVFEEYSGPVSLCKGSTSSGDSTTTIRYAPYIEARHSNFLETVFAAREVAIATSPFADYTEIDTDEAFFGAYLLSSFPSLYAMFGTYMTDIDLDTLWDTTFENTINSTVVDDLIAAESAMMDDDIAINSLPRLQLGMRDINSAMSSSFVVGKAIIEDARVKSLNRFSAGLKHALIPVAAARWSATLEWNKGVVGMYSELLKFYFSARADTDEVNYTMKVKDKLWPFTVLDFERAALGALQGATNSKTDVAGASTTAKVLSGALSGAAMGAMIGSNFNTAASGVVGQAGYTAASSAGSMYGAGAGAVLGIAAALTY